MLHDIAFVIWFFLPAAFANSVPIAAAKIPGIRRWNTPIDLGYTFRGRQLLGPHKTWRGVITGMIIATITLWIEQSLVRHTGWASRLTEGFNYMTYPTLILGPLFAVGALGGDALKSFFKRQYNKQSGTTWFPFDQLDYIIGGALLSALYIRLNLAQYIWLFIVWFLAHLLASYLGWRAHLKSSPI